MPKPDDSDVVGSRRPQVTLGLLFLGLTAIGRSPAGWSAKQDALATLSTDSVHRVIKGVDHTGMIADEKGAAAGVVTFHALNDQTRVTLQLEFEPEGRAEQAGDKLGMVSRRIEGDLDRFKDFIEGRGSETGAWRGEIER